MSISINEENRDEGEETIAILIEAERPEECEGCPFHIRNINQDKLESEEEVFYCQIKAKLVSAQFGGVDIRDPKFFKCPLKPIEESEPYIYHEERIRALEEALGELESIVEALERK